MVSGGVSTLPPVAALQGARQSREPKQGDRRGLSDGADALVVDDRRSGMGVVARAVH